MANRKGIIQGFSHKEMSKDVGRTCRNEKNFKSSSLLSFIWINLNDHLELNIKYGG